jgi:hypothetical protein
LFAPILSSKQPLFPPSYAAPRWLVPVSSSGPNSPTHIRLETGRQAGLLARRAD